MGDLIETGTVRAQFPDGVESGLARLIGTLLKQDFQRAVLARIPLVTSHAARHWREVLFLCDEYHAFATAGEEDPTGDEKFFSLSRQGKCIAIVATQSLVPSSPPCRARRGAPYSKPSARRCSSR